MLTSPFGDILVSWENLNLSGVGTLHMFVMPSIRMFEGSSARLQSTALHACQLSLSWG